MSGRNSFVAQNSSAAIRTSVLAAAIFGFGSLMSGTLRGEPPIKAEKPTEKADNPQPVVPPVDPKSALAEKLVYPDPQRAIWAGSRDGRGLRVLGSGVQDYQEISRDKPSHEYQAWNEAFSIVNALSASSLEEFGRRDLTWDDLVGTGAPPQTYRVKLIRIEGKLVRVRRMEATTEIQENSEHRISEVYEALVTAYDDPPTEQFSVMFIDLPPALAELKKHPPGEWMEVNADAIAAGYFFKVKQDPKLTVKYPVLIAKSVTLLPAPGSAVDGKVAVAIDPTPQVFKAIKDDARVAKGDDNWQEAVAWNRVALHARRFSAEELEANARADLKFADLFEDPARRDYKLQLVKFEGRLLLVRKMEATQKLSDAGIKTAYEGWLAPRDEPRGNPICIVFTDLPEGIEPGRMSRWVSFAGYSFKLMQYESGEVRPDDASRHVVKRAPMLIGRAIVLRPDPDAATTPLSWQNFVTVMLAVVLGLAITAGAITIWYRRGDRRARKEISDHRSRNPFAAT